MEIRKDSSHELNSPHISLQPQLQDVLEILEAVNDDDASYEQLARLIETRGVIAAAIARTANSASVGISQQSRSLKHSLALIGMQRVRDILTDMQLEIVGKTESDDLHVSA